MQSNEITHEIIGCAYEVVNQLGVGFPEKVYENALCIELSKQGLIAQQQKIIDVYYKEILVGEYVADLLVEDLVIEGYLDG
jgi:GxxExxY protein